MPPTYEITSPEGQTYELTPPEQKAYVPSTDFSKLKCVAQPDNANNASALQELIPSLARGVVKGGQTTLGTSVNAYEILSKLLGGQPSQAPRQLLNESVSDLDKLIPPPQTITGNIAQGVGELPNMIATYSNPVSEAVGTVPLAGTIGAINNQQEGLGGAIKGAAENATQMALFQQANKLPMIGRVPAGAAIGAAPGILSGQDSNKTISDAVLGAGFSLFNPDAVDRTVSEIKQFNEVAKNPKAFLEAQREKILRDPYASAQQAIDDDEAHISILKDAAKFQDRMEAQRLAEIESQSKTDQSAIKESMTEEQKRFKVEQDKLDEQNKADIAKLENERSDIIKTIPSNAEDLAYFLQKQVPVIQKKMSASYGKISDRVFDSIDSKTMQQTQQIQGGLEKLKQDYMQENPDPNSKFLKTIGDFETKFNDMAGSGTTPSQDPIGDYLKENSPTDKSKAKPGQLESIARQWAANGKIDALRQFEKVPGTFDKLKAQLEASQATQGVVPLKDVAKLFRSTVIDKQAADSHEAYMARGFLGDQVAMKDPRYAELQQSYWVNKSYLKRLKTVSGYAGGEAATGTGSKFMQDYALGKADIADKRLIKWIESGYKGGENSISFPGTGNFTADFDGIRQRLQYYDQTIKAMKDKDYAEYAQAASNIMQDHMAKMEALQKQGQLTEAEFTKKMIDAQNDVGKLRIKLEQEMNAKEQILSKNKNSLAETKRVHQKIDRLIAAFFYSLGAFGAWKFGRLGMASTRLDQAVNR